MIAKTDIVDFLGRLELDPIALPADASLVWVEADAVPDQRVRISLSLLFSPDGGATWQHWETSTHSGGRDVIVNRARVRDEFGVLVREDGIALDKRGDAVSVWPLKQAINLSGFIGTPLIRGIIESITVPLTTQVRVGVA